MSSSSESLPLRVLQCASASSDATWALAESLGRLLRPGDALGLGGELGAGKTLFVRGLAEGCGTDPSVPVCSPTFTLANVYPGRTTLYHLDLYRLEDEDDLEAIGYRDYADGSGIIAVEWFDRITDILPDDHLRLWMRFIGPEERALRFEAPGERGASLLMEIVAIAAGISGLDVSAIETVRDA